MRLFRILFAIDALGLLLVAAYLFVDWLRYSSGEHFSVGVLVLGVPMLVLGASWALNGSGNTTMANMLLGVLAAALLLIGLSVVLQPLPCVGRRDHDSITCADPA